ncbi:MAG: heme exporter protein CcmD [Pseudomonadota bacterium]
MTEFFAMGGYAAFVWPAYGVSALVVGAVSFAIWRRGRRLKRRLDAFEKDKD